jgi:hypothetical protein
VRDRIDCAGRVVLILAALAALPVSVLGQDPDPLDVAGKLRFHAESASSPTAVLGIAAYAGALQFANSPTEWGQGAEPYG